MRTRLSLPLGRNAELFRVIKSFPSEGYQSTDVYVLQQLQNTMIKNKEIASATAPTPPRQIKRNLGLKTFFIVKAYALPTIVTTTLIFLL